MKRAFALGVLVLGLAFCWGCPQSGGQEKKTPGQAPPAATAAPAAPAAPAKEAVTTAAAEEPRQEWRYDPSYKWDPFVLPPAPVRVGEASQRYDLDQMSLMGVMRGSGMDGAFVRLPDGSDRIIRKGDIIGKHGGVVTEIGNDFVVVEERYMDPKHPNDTFVIEKELRLQQRKLLPR